MNKKELHNLVKKICPTIHYLDDETDEVCEGECTMWERDDCTIIVEFGEMPSEQNIQLVQDKLLFLNNNQELILEKLLKLFQEKNLDFNLKYLNFNQIKQSFSMVWVACFAESIEETSVIFCDFALHSESHHLTIECSLEEDNSLIFQDIIND